MIYSELREDFPVHFFGANYRPPSAKTLKRFPIEHPGLHLINDDAYFLWAPLDGVLLSASLL